MIPAGFRRWGVRRAGGPQGLQFQTPLQFKRFLPEPGNCDAIPLAQFSHFKGFLFLEIHLRALATVL
jgi:hypothetical protein